MKKRTKKSASAKAPAPKTPAPATKPAVDPASPCLQPTGPGGCTPERRRVLEAIANRAYQLCRSTHLEGAALEDTGKVIAICARHVADTLATPEPLANLSAEEQAFIVASVIHTLTKSMSDQLGPRLGLAMFTLEAAPAFLRQGSPAEDLAALIRNIRNR